MLRNKIAIMVIIVVVIPKGHKTNNNDKLLFLLWKSRQSDSKGQSPDAWWPKGTSMLQGREEPVL